MRSAEKAHRQLELVEKLGPTLVTYEHVPAGDNVKLTMLHSHDRPISDDMLSGDCQGWPAILSSLKTLLGDRRRDDHPDEASRAHACRAEGDGSQDAVEVRLCSRPHCSRRR